MTEVTIHELRGHCRDLVDRAAAGERVIITRGGRPVAELRSVHAALVSASILLQRWEKLAPMDPATLRADLAETVDPTA